MVSGLKFIFIGKPSCYFLSQDLKALNTFFLYTYTFATMFLAFLETSISYYLFPERLKFLVFKNNRTASININERGESKNKECEAFERVILIIFFH